MFEKSPDQLASLKVQMMDKTAYCTQRHIILLDDTAKNLKEGMSTTLKPGQSRPE
jgi:ariadne-1